jgi:hypothetical protein
MKKLIICTIVTGIVCLAGMLAMRAWGPRGGTLYGSDFQLSANKSRCKVGDEIVLRGRIVPRTKQSIVFSDALHESIRLLNIQESHSKEPSRGKRVVHTLTSENPFTFEIRGLVVEKEGKVRLDFGVFGTSLFENRIVSELRFTAMPLNIGPADSGEWGPSNSLQFTLE